MIDPSKEIQRKKRIIYWIPMSRSLLMKKLSVGWGATITRSRNYKQSSWEFFFGLIITNLSKARSFHESTLSCFITNKTEIKSLMGPALVFSSVCFLPIWKICCFCCFCICRSSTGLSVKSFAQEQSNKRNNSISDKKLKNFVTNSNC